MVRIVARDQPRRGFADMADAQRVDQAVQPDGAAALDRRHQIFDQLVFASSSFFAFLTALLAFGGAAFLGQLGAMLGQHLAHLLRLLRSGAKISAGSFSRPFSWNSLDHGAAQAFDVEAVADDEIAAAAPPSGRRRSARRCSAGRHPPCRSSRPPRARHGCRRPGICAGNL